MDGWIWVAVVFLSALDILLRLLLRTRCFCRQNWCSLDVWCTSRSKSQRSHFPTFWCLINWSSRMTSWIALLGDDNKMSEWNSNGHFIRHLSLMWILISVHLLEQFEQFFFFLLCQDSGAKQGCRLDKDITTQTETINSKHDTLFQALLCIKKRRSTILNLTPPQVYWEGNQRQNKWQRTSFFPPYLFLSGPEEHDEWDLGSSCDMQ